MTTHRTTLIAAAVLAMFTAPAFAQTPPPNSPHPEGTGTLVCHFDSNDGTIHLERVNPSLATQDRGVATEGHDTLAEGGQCLPQPQSTVPATPTAPVPPVPVEGVQVTPTPTAAPAEPTATAQPTAEPTATAEPTWTPEPRVPEPTVPAGPLPSCYPGGPEPCEGK